MKCSEYAIQRFKLICRDEENTPDDIVQKKLTRDFVLGIFLNNSESNTYISAFGTLRIKMFNDEIIDVWRSSKYYPINKYAKYKWNYENGLENTLYSNYA